MLRRVEPLVELLQCVCEVFDGGSGMASSFAHKDTIWGFSHSLADVLTFPAQKYWGNVLEVCTL